VIDPMSGCIGIVVNWNASSDGFPDIRSHARRDRETLGFHFALNRTGYQRAFFNSPDRFRDC
jgi:hypothetical protein